MTVDEPQRLISGLIVPFHVPGRMKTGGTGDALLSFRPGALTWPKDVTAVKLLIEHDQRQAVGYAVELVETARGVEGAFHLPDTHESTRALSDVLRRLRDAFSPGIEPDGATRQQLRRHEVVSARGELREVSLVTVPAYTDARAVEGALHVLR